ncbi:acyltransferase [Actinotalea sp. K2]|uniref:acyltransferase family protein n=1 Tax=Actinotalea sp. K2 TaxID=2939438 RepID=UPI002017B8B3|nr:acyltransferase [Actinotalea sp. K2]MCL3861296.1 acyltransferase [Actinotalea sp. K2]
MQRPENPRARTLAGFVDPRANTLNFVRLILAGSVVFWHAYPLNGHPFPWEGGRQIAGSIGVDGFFAISGFLLAGSWLHKPHIATYAKNRLLRIMPAFWVCLLVVGFGFAPLAALAQGGSVGQVLDGPHSALQYVLRNSALTIQFHDVAGTPADVPLSGVWNGSLWTLRWEALAYVGLAALGLLGILRHRAAVLALLGLLWLATIGLAADVLPQNYWLVNGTRLGLMFVAGMVLHLYGDRITSRWWLAAVCTALLVASPLLPDYRILAGPAVAYLVIWSGGRITDPRLRLTDRDISYGLYIYAFPIQQALVIAGSAALPPLVAAVLAIALTVPLAVASWVLVERPALRLKYRRLWPRAWSRVRLASPQPTSSLPGTVPVRPVAGHTGVGHLPAVVIPGVDVTDPPPPAPPS